jgi:hypothetical protein
MAITNASDLLVYAKTSSPVKQITRIKVLTTAPFSVFETGKKGVLSSNITKADGSVIDNYIANATANTGTNLITSVGTILSGTFDYSLIGTTQTDGDYTYRDYENGATGIVPTLEIVSGSGTLKDDAIVIEIITPGSSAVLDPVAYSTSASFSTNIDLRDVTNKDSEGWSESRGGLKSFEVSTDILQSINPDVPLDGTDFFDKLKTRSLVDLSFSDRIRNILTTNLTTSGQGGFSLDNITQVVGQTDPFGGTTASSILATSASDDAIKTDIPTARLENKKLSWSFYVRGDGTTTKATFRITNVALADLTYRVISGNGSETIAAYTAPGTGYYKIEGLNTTWCRVAVEFPSPINVIDPGEGTSSHASDVSAVLFPGLSEAQGSSAKVFTSSWQIEQRGSATDYQDPTSINRWQGDAIVTSVSFDAGVEDNLTCSATFTGTGINTLNT